MLPALPGKMKTQHGQQSFSLGEGLGEGSYHSQNLSKNLSSKIERCTIDFLFMFRKQQMDILNVMDSSSK
jgi:hypothetical protein